MEAPIVAAFGHPCEGVKVAACSCVKSLSRSVKVSLSLWPIHMKTYVSQGSCWVHFSSNFRVPSLMIVFFWAEPSDGLNRWTLGDSSAATIEWSIFSGAGETVFQHYVIGGFCLSGVHWGSQKEVTRSFFWPYITTWCPSRFGIVSCLAFFCTQHLLPQRLHLICHFPLTISDGTY